MFIKSRLMFFPEYVNELQETSIQRLISQHRDGYLVYHYLLKECYKNGYFAEWFEKDSPFIVARFLNKKETFIREVLNYCLYLGLFNKELLESRSILTSKYIQEQYVVIKKMTRRKLDEINDDYRLIDREREAAIISSIKNYFDNDCENGNSVQNDTNSVQKPQENVQNLNKEKEKEKETEKKHKESSSSFSVENEMGKILIHKKIPEFETVLLQWFEYKAGRGEMYKNKRTVKACITRLYNNCNSRLDIAEFMINKAISEGWVGFFTPNQHEMKMFYPEKLNKNGKSTDNTKGVTSSTQGGYGERF